MKDVLRCDSVLNMTYLALNLSHYVNGVAKRTARSRARCSAVPHRLDHQRRARGHLDRAPFQALFDQHIPDWRQDNFNLRYAIGIPPQEFWAAHAEAKRALHRPGQRAPTGHGSTPTLDVGFARRAATYKRADLLFTDLDRLDGRSPPAPARSRSSIAGKAHPHDEGGKEADPAIVQARRRAQDARCQDRLPGQLRYGTWRS